jgi:hypothetical protein
MTLHRSFQQAPIEAKRYIFDYSCWLEESEMLTEYIVAVSPPTVPPLIAQSAFPDPTKRMMSVMITGGINRQTYTVMMVVTTTTGQRKRDDIQMRVVAQ